MANYDAFDGITEPRRPQSRLVLMRLACTRRSRTAFLVSIVCVLLVIVGWRGSEKVSSDSMTVGPRLCSLTFQDFPSTHRFFLSGVNNPLISIYCKAWRWNRSSAQIAFRSGAHRRRRAKWIEENYTIVSSLDPGFQIQPESLQNDFVSTRSQLSSSHTSQLRQGLRRDCLAKRKPYRKGTRGV